MGTPRHVLEAKKSGTDSATAATSVAVVFEKNP